MSNTKKKLSSKFITILYLILFGVVIVASVVIAMYFYRNIKIDTVDEKQKYDKYYVMITEDRDLDLWQSVYEGAKKSGGEQGIYVELMGENLYAEYADTDLLEIAIASKVDGIIVYANESEEMTKLINEAGEAGIPVVTVLGDNTQSTRCSFVGVGSYNLGREYGKQIVKIVKDKENGDTISSTHANDVINVVGIINSYADSSTQSIIWSGVQSFVETENDTETSINMSLAYVDNKSTYTVEESIRDIFKNQETPDIIVCFNETTTACVYQSLIDYNMVGKTNLLGYYDSDVILKGISRNVIYSSVTVDTEQLGNYCVNALNEYNETGNTSQLFLADITLIDKTNVSEFYQEEGEN
ncbi:MAG: substrate-binding domain-containing protein [Lachnospiraceae bacterium]|nr:substrate-binding domain-containing protein [Lachnospiraceae bacterium]